MWCEVDLVLLFVSYVNVCSSTCMSVFEFALWLNSQIKSVQLKIKGSLWGQWHNNKVFKVPLGLICHGDQTSVVRITEVLQFNINAIPDDSKDSQYSHGSHTKHGKLNPAHKCIKMWWNLKTNVILTGHFCCSESLSVCLKAEFPSVIIRSLSLPFQENKDCSTVIKWKESYEQPAAKNLCKKNNLKQTVLSNWSPLSNFQLLFCRESQLIVTQTQTNSPFLARAQWYLWLAFSSLLDPPSSASLLPPLSYFTYSCHNVLCKSPGVD